MKKITALVSTLLPSFVFAQQEFYQQADYVTSQPLNQIRDVNSLSLKLASIGNVVIYLLIGLAIVFIVWNVVMTLISGDKPDEKKAALTNIGYGLLGLAIIVSIWGLVNILIGTFNTDNYRPEFPTANFNE